MLDANERELDSVDTEEEAETEIPFESCTTFSELFEELDRELLKLPKVDKRAIAMLKHRHEAFGEPKLTLDDIGKEWGVTRERVRQIVDPLVRVRIQVDFEVRVLLKAVELFEQCEDEDQFKSLVLDDDMFAGEEITWERLWCVAGMLSQKALAKRIYEKHLEFEADSGINYPFRELIKKDRSKFGLFDLQVISNKYEINADKAFKVISEIYPRSIRSGNLVLARTRNQDTMFENSIAKQLKVSSPLDLIDLLKGLQRTGSNRGVFLIGSTADLSNLILDLAGNPPNYETASGGLVKEVDFQSITRHCAVPKSKCTLKTKKASLASIKIDNVASLSIAKVAKAPGVLASKKKNSLCSAKLSPQQKTCKHKEESASPLRSTNIVGICLDSKTVPLPLSTSNLECLNNSDSKLVQHVRDCNFILQ
jgi:hypothetical protein